MRSQTSRTALAWKLCLNNDLAGTDKLTAAERQSQIVNVRAGLTDLDRVEIISGLDVRHKVFLLPSAHLVETQEKLQSFITRRVGGVPRIGGLGNWTNQGLQGFMLPVGAVNAGDPDSAYAEAVALGIAHNHSFALEGAAVMAASFAEAFAPDATLDSAIQAGVDRAQDGTREALDAVLPVVDASDDEQTFIRRVRQAYLPFAGLPPSRLQAEEPDTHTMAGTNMGVASRIMCIENLPVSMATLVYAKGDALRTLREMASRSDAAAQRLLAEKLRKTPVIPVIVIEDASKTCRSVARYDVFLFT